ncbi:histidine phosphatase family protein [Niveibacterium sp. 24ML]|uniref:SixA phosphatase family protein n=1 Tax=Niveibacterium sp. 24ML TaxID=2985512 RepID=UPI0022700D76|nr:histidine phosphatase family protein [Niveibacterium sp. 24ML]MCX9157634.1 histidine phosphatase family protein [Niveibacterium sp. 24ML]
MSTAKGMDLILWRHAEAEYSSPDETRALTEKGRDQAERMARWLTRNAPKDLKIIVSPATRTRQTVAPFSSKIAIDPRVSTSGSPESLLEAAGWPKTDGAVLVVGHQPTLGEVAAMLLGQAGAEMSVKKGSIWWFRVRERHGVRETILKAVVPAELT